MMDPVNFSLFDSLLEPTLVIDANELVCYLNPAAAQIMQSTPRKILREKRKLSELFIFQDPVSALKHLSSISEPTPYEEVAFTTPLGGVGRVQITVQPLPFSQGLFLVFARDVTLEETLQKKYQKELSLKEDVIVELQRAKAQIDEYAKGLERMVEERTRELAHMNRKLKALLDSLQQGFFMFDQSGTVLDIATRSCVNLLEKDPRGLPVAQVLGINAKDILSFNKWVSTLFQESLPFEDLAPLGPKRYQHSQGRVIELSYFPVRNEVDEVESVVVVVTDVTNLIEAQERAARERAYANLILKLTQNKKHFALFYREAVGWIQQAKELLEKQDFDHDEVFRALHSLKGGASSFSMLEVAQSCHMAEGILSEPLPLDEKREKLKRAILQIEEKFRNFKMEFNEFIKRFDEINGVTKEISEKKLIEFADRFLPSQLKHTFYLEFLFEPIGDYLQNLNVTWLETARALHKKVYPIEVINGQILIWPSPYEPIFAALVHVIRNAIDHGIEAPHERTLLGKEEFGRFTVRVEQEEHMLHLLLCDDGAGIDVHKLKEKLSRVGIDPQKMSEYEIMQSIFMPQISTRDQVSDLSGRGVGLDALKAAVLSVGGQIWVQSQKGKGTTFHLVLPYLIPGGDSHSRQQKVA
ncbi:MAG: ATP-binding protein [Bdellovibrionaceae bacterium]|nr:ATP-binding protein [Pseudobdellovibrionaceae bacterium]MDW8191216.1 ATP-binding protein [Pseudobdellovibrionaceae bacterium]